MGNITRKHLVNEVAVDTFKDPEAVKPIIYSLLNMLVSHIVSGDTIELRGFGTFTPGLRKQRPAHNPKTGEAVEDIPRRYVPTLKFSPSIRRAMPRFIDGK